MLSCNQRKLIYLWTALAVLLSLLLVLSGLAYGRHMPEKILTRLLVPVGLIWLSLLLGSLSVWVVGRRQLASAGLVLWLLFGVAGSTRTGDWIMAGLEGRYEPVDPASCQAFDTLIILGGGTLSDRQQHVWLGFAGDRVMLAARLFHQGKVEQLITTGQALAWGRGRSVDPSVATAQIWQELGVPEERITQVGGGNTALEMQEIRQRLGDRPPARVGLLTSAFHLPRAERLARQQDLTVVPVACGFLGPVEDPWPMAVVPSAYGFHMTELAAKEYLAAIVGR